ncbi:MAG TPA: acyltransferase family protein [Streptosporangiaceae bacterium]|nr:acyltransferase family protein [Streptosporangiaceae bacterium]
MPKPVRSGQRYMPGLDGLRALAVLAVVAYHLDVRWAQGGLLGVGVFFTLSGYLITDLLLSQWETTGRMRLPDFWRRRARRLLPALFVMLTVVAAWVTLLDRPELPAIRGAVAASAAYVGNWWLIAQHSSYFAQFAPPMPLDHLWSLAVEEQFYLIWPWLLWLGLRWVRGRPWGFTKLAVATLLLAVLSSVAMDLLYRPGYDPTRVYYGTDTRAFAVLIGAALAIVWPSRLLGSEVRASARWILDGIGFAGLAVIALLIVRTGEYSPFLYRGGMVLLSVSTALVVGAVASPVSRLGLMLGWRPLRWIGVRSYGIYLWHYPIIVLTTPPDGRETLLRGMAQLAAAIGVAALSWRFVEEPIRHGALGRWWAQVRSTGWHLGAVGRRSKVTVAGTVLVVGLASCGLAGVVRPPARPAVGTQPPPPPIPTASRSPGNAATGSPGPAATGGSARTSCRSVVHIGDSTSDGLISPDYLPNPRRRIGAQYARVGVTRFIPEISGGTSIVETSSGQPNAYDVAQQLIRDGYRGCWVLALGTNDTADVAIGSQVGRATRIREMMSLAHGQPVMWVNVKSLLATGPYSEDNMLAWNAALIRACARYPNMRVYDWASVVKDSWFITDGIHYTSAGYAARARRIARALAAAFPEHAGGAAGVEQTGQGTRAPACLVH